MDAIVTISEYQGTVDGLSYSPSHTDVRVQFVPATHELYALYEQMPQGQGYEFRVLSDTIGNLKPQAKLVVTDPQVSGYAVDDTFITITDTKRMRLGGRFHLVGICYLAEPEEA